MTWRNTQIC